MNELTNRKKADFFLDKTLIYLHQKVSHNKRVYLLSLLYVEEINNAN